jgi:hypothetical protein
MTVSGEEFLRRFLIHVLPRGLVRIRHFGLFANRKRRDALARCRILLGGAKRASDPEITTQSRCPVLNRPHAYHRALDQQPTLFPVVPDITRSTEVRR